MRIFTAVRHSIDPRAYYGALWSANFYPALRALGHDLIESQVDLHPTSRFMDVGSGFTGEERAVRSHTTERIIAEVSDAHRRAPIDLFLSYFYNAHFDPAGFDEIRRLGIRSVNFYCNSIYQFELVADVAAGADVAWHAERDARDSYLRAKANPVWVQMGADPSVYRPIAEAERKPAACFVGQCYADRDQWMAALVRAGIPVEIYGPGWGAPGSPAAAAGEAESSYLGRARHRPSSAGAYVHVISDMLRRDGPVEGARRVMRVMQDRRSRGSLAELFTPHARGPVPFTDVARIFSQHEVCLNFSNVWADGQPGAALIPHVRLRDFEAPMCRTCYLTGHTDEIESFYEAGTEIDTYRTPEELVDKTRYYLNHPDAAERLREAGYRRALRDHTWERRFELLFRTIGAA